MYSNRGMPLGRLWRKRKGKPLDRSCAHKTVPKQQKAVWAKASHCGLNREKTGNGRGNRDSVSKVQVRRTAVSAAYCGEKDECVGRALPVAFGTGAPFFLTGKAAYFVSVEIRPPFCQEWRTFVSPKAVCAPCFRSYLIRSLR